jgi:hypothetical protein
MASQRYLSQFWGPEDKDIECPICKHTDWSILHAVDLPIRYIPGRVLTVVPVQCNTCKHVIFFNGVAAGFFGADGMPSDMPQESQPEVGQEPSSE